MAPTSCRLRQVHLFDHGLAIADAAPGDHRQALGEPGGVGATVRLQEADHHVAPGLLFGVPLEQHLVGLADAGGHADEELQPPLLRGPGRTRRGFGGGREL